ncbi:MAG: TolC family protein [Spirochaetales bacterium]|nr:TolC family protein [Spirochaetales bacterium]
MKRSVLLFISIILFGTQSFGLDFLTVIGQLDATFDVKAALLKVEGLEKEIAALSNPEDFSFTLNPTVKVTSQETGAFGEEIDLSGTTSFKIPIGLSAPEREKLENTIDSLVIAKESVITAREKMYFKLYSLYQSVWLLQEEEPVLAMELRAAENYSEIMDQRFTSGAVSLVSLASAEATLQERGDEYSRNILRQRLAWFELMFNADLNMIPESLEKKSLEMTDIPKPPELTDWVEDNHPLVKAERIKLNQMKKSIEEIKKTDLDISIKPFVNYGGHSASLSYTFSDPELTAAYSFPVYTYGEIPAGSGSSSSTCNTGVTVNISLGSNRSDLFNADVEELSLRSAEAGLSYLIESLSLELRSSYQQLIRNQGVYDQAKRNLERSLDNKSIIETKMGLGQTSEFELLEAESIVSRTEWKIESARINTELSWLKVLEDAVWFSKAGLDF